MKHDPELTRLLLIQLRDGGHEEQIKKYSDRNVLEQQARLIDEGLATGQAVKDGLELKWVLGLQISTGGHKWLEAREVPQAEQTVGPAKTEIESMVEKTKAIDILEALKARIPEISKNPSVQQSQFKRWRPQVEAAIQHIFPKDDKYLPQFRDIRFVTTAYSAAVEPGAAEGAFRSGLDEADCLIHAMLEEIKTYWSETGKLVIPQHQAKGTGIGHTRPRDPRAVFVVHGRNEAIRSSMFTFLRAIGLTPLEWSGLRAETRDPNPYVGHILDTAFSAAQAFVVVMTPDDEARLKDDFRMGNDPHHEAILTGQARPNVLFEAGMAMGYDSKRTVLVEIGVLRPFSDIIGRHTVRLDNSPEKRKELAERLETAGCPVDLKGTDWFKAGSFELNEVALTTALVFLKFNAEILNRLSSESPRYYCEIDLENGSDSETLTNVSIGIESFKLLPELEHGYGQNAPRRNDFPMPLTQPNPISILPKRNFKLEFLEIVRQPEPTIKIASRIFRLHNALKLQFIVAVSANLRQTQWRVEMDSIRDAIGVPTLLVKPIERINL
jgi:predicted nucleotide-binding protein